MSKPPPEPTAALVDAGSRYRSLIESGKARGLSRVELTLDLLGFVVDSLRIPGDDREALRLRVHDFASDYVDRLFDYEDGEQRPVLQWGPPVVPLPRSQSSGSGLSGSGGSRGSTPWRDFGGSGSCATPIRSMPKRPANRPRFSSSE